ncbi:hypothetical protein FKO01_41265 [Mesorhizobium sp. B2-3-3]|nr:hypothetical protein FKO01_41265 [Mesorhizobium sp. B2-3-3]
MDADILMVENLEQLKLAISKQHGGKPEYRQSVPVDERHNGKPVWQGVVHVFDLADHPKATRAFAWSSPIEGSSKRRFFAVLQLGAIKTPADAVRAAIVAQDRRR